MSKYTAKELAAEIVAEMQAALVSDANLCAVARMRGMRPQLVTHSELRDWASRVAQLAKPEATCVCTARARIVELEDIADAIQEDHDLAESGCLALEEDLKFANARIAKFSGERDAAIADLDQANVRVVKLELRDMEVAEQIEAHYKAQCVAEDLRNVARDERDAALRKVKKLQNMVDCTTQLCQRVENERDETRKALERSVAELVYANARILRFGGERDTAQAECNALEALLERKLTPR